MQCNTIQYILLCNAFEWDTVEYATRHLYFPYTHETLGECVYEENTSDKCHVPRYPTRKHCITTLFHACITGNVTEIFGMVRKSPGFRKTSETLQNRFLVYTIRKIFGKSSESSDRNFQNNFFKIIKVLN